MFKNSLSNQLLTFRTWQIVNAVFLKVNYFSAFQFQLTVVCETFDFDVKRLWGFGVGGEVDSVREGHPEREKQNYTTSLNSFGLSQMNLHVIRQKLRVVVEPLNFRFRQSFLYVTCQRWSQMPSNFFQLQQSIVEIRKCATNISLKQRVAIPDHGEDCFIASFLVLKCCLMIFLKCDINFF